MSGWAFRNTADTTTASAQIATLTRMPPWPPCASMAMPASAEPMEVPINWPVPIQPNASAVSERSTARAITEDTAASAGAMPRPATNSAMESPTKPDVAVATAKPLTTTSSRRVSDQRVS